MTAEIEQFEKHYEHKNTVSYVEVIVSSQSSRSYEWKYCQSG